MNKDYIVNKMAALYKKLGGDYWKGRFLFDVEARQVVKGNNKFKDIYKGQRCFILGNAPSLKNVNFSDLADEIVFTVNSIMLVEGYEKLESNFHFWMDEITFGKYNTIDENAMIQNMKKMGKTKKIECFVPYIAREFVKKNKLEDYLNINYIFSTEKRNQSFKRITLDKGMYGFNSTVQYAIATAMYMGFSEIYLLGVEETVVIDILTSRRNGFGFREEENNVGHAYSVDNSYHVPPISLDALLSRFAGLFQGYNWLEMYGKKNNVILKNCTPNSLVETIPFIDLDEIL